MIQIFAETNDELSLSAEVNNASFIRKSDESSSEGDIDDTNNIYLNNDNTNSLREKHLTRNGKSQAHKTKD